MQFFPLVLDTNEAFRIMVAIDVSETGRAIMAERFSTVCFLVRGLSSPGANVLKQHLLSLGEEAAVPHYAVNCAEPKSDVLFAVRRDRIASLARRLRMQCWGLPKIAEALERYRDASLPWFSFRHDRIPTDRPALMGILNVTPDSFSDGGRYSSVEAAVERAFTMAEQGADIVDIGGESTRPGAAAVTEQEEIDRVIPVIREMRRRNLRLPVSIDTTKATVAREALFAGADMVNDISAMSFDPAMPRVVAEACVPVVLQHLKGLPRTMQQNPVYADLFGEINLYFEVALARAQEAGISPENILLDPGFGFGKTVEHNLMLLRHLESFHIHGCPLLVGVSRKTFIGKTTGRELPTDRLAGTLAAQTMALLKGAAVLRLHDVTAGRDILAMYRAVREATCF